MEQIVTGKVAYPGIIRDINAERPVKAMEAAKTKLVTIIENLEKPAVLPPIGEDPVYTDAHSRSTFIVMMLIFLGFQTVG